MTARHVLRINYGTATRRSGMNPDTVDYCAYNADRFTGEDRVYYATERGYQNHVSELVNNLTRDGHRIIADMPMRNGGRFIVYMPHWARGPHTQPSFALIPPIWHERAV